MLVFAHSGQFSGGAERSLMELLKYFKNIGTESVVVAPEGGDFVDSCIEAGVRTVILHELVPSVSFASLRWVSGVGRFNQDDAKPDRFAICIREIARAVGDFDFDLVYTNTTVTPLGAFYAAHMGKPHVWHVREFIDRDFGWPFALGKFGCYQFMEQFSDRVIAISAAIRDSLSEHFVQPEKISVIQNGPLTGKWLEDPKRNFDTQGRPIKLCVMGAISPHKGQLDAVKALAELRKRGHDFELYLYGKVSDEEYFREACQFADQNGIRPHMHFEGLSEEPRRTWLGHDIAIVSSRAEAFGRVTVEAMSTAMPVVGAASGGTIEILEPNATGLLYEPGNSIDLADKIEQLLLDPALWERVGTLGREKAIAEYSLRHCAENVLALFAAVASDKRESLVEPVRAINLLNTLMLSISMNINQHQVIAQNRNQQEMWHEIEQFRAELLCYQDEVVRHQDAMQGMLSTIKTQQDTIKTQQDLIERLEASWPTRIYRCLGVPFTILRSAAGRLGLSR